MEEDLDEKLRRLLDDNHKLPTTRQRPILVRVKAEEESLIDLIKSIVSEVNNSSAREHAKQVMIKQFAPYDDVATQTDVYIAKPIPFWKFLKHLKRPEAFLWYQFKSMDSGKKIQDKFYVSAFGTYPRQSSEEKIHERFEQYLLKFGYVKTKAGEYEKSL